MFKLITYGILGYFFYRYFIKPILPVPYEEQDRPRRKSSAPKRKKKRSNDDDYIDYEEVD